MARDRFRWFTGRTAEIAAFDRMLAASADDWHCLAIEGMSGTGKSFLMDYLRREHRADLPSVDVELRPDLDQWQLLQRICFGLGGVELEESFTSQAEALERSAPVSISVAPSFTVTGAGAAQLSGVTQTGQLTVNVDRRLTEAMSQRLDVLVRVLAPFASRTWVLFLDEAEHLRNRDVGLIVMRQLVPRLRRRFPGFRLVLAGQIVPVDGLEEHEVVRAVLAPFEPGDTQAMLRAIGVDDPRIAATLQTKTGGLPFRLNMYGFLHASSDGGADEHADVGGEEWTARVYDEVVGRIGHEDLRDAAPYLALLDFFDEGLIEAIFEIEIDRSDFRELVQRSFAKRIAPNRWRCHDIIRNELAGRLRQANPERCDEVLRRAFTAFLKRLVTERERHGRFRFEGRVELAVAALSSAGRVSTHDAIAFLEDELVLAVLYGGGEYVLALTRASEREGMPAQALARLRGLEQALERGLAQSSTLADAKSFAEMAAHAAAIGQPDHAVKLYSVVHTIAAATGDPRLALTAVTRAAALQPESVELQLALASTHLLVNEVDHARELLDEVSRRFGPSPALRVSQAELLFHLGDTHEARRVLTRAIEEFDSAVEPRIALAWHLRKEDDPAAALTLIDAALQREPTSELAQRLRLQLLAELGRWDQVRSEFLRRPDAVTAGMDAGWQSTRALADPRVRLAALEQVKERPASVSLHVFNALGEAFATAGEVERIPPIAQICIALHPESRPTWQQLEAAAWMRVRRFADAIPILQQLVASEPGMAFAPFLLATCHAQLGALEEGRAVLESWRRTHPSADDFAVFHIAAHFHPDVAAALKFLDGVGELGPSGCFARALLLARSGDPVGAAAAIEALLLSDLMLAAPRQLGIEARLVRIRLLHGLGRVADAKEAAARLLALFGSEDAAIDLAAELHAGLGELAAVDRITAPWKRGGPAKVMGRLVHMANAVLADGPSLEELARRTEAEPMRLELAFALGRLVRPLPQSDREAWSQRAQRVAADAFVELRLLSEQASRAVSPAEKLAMEKEWANSPQTDLESASGVLRIRIVDGRLDQARELVERMSQRFPDQAELFESTELGFLFDAKRFDALRERIAPLLLESAAVPPHMTQYLSVVADSCLPPDEAIAVHRRIAEQHPRQRAASIGSIAALQLAAGDALAALATLDQLAAGEVGEVARIRVDVLATLGRYEDALEVVDGVLAALQPRRDKLTRVHAMVERGRCLRGLDRHDEAMATYRAALELHPRSPGAHLGLMRCHEHEQRWQQAYDAALDAIAEDPRLQTQFEADVRRLGALARSETPVKETTPCPS